MSLEVEVLNGGGTAAGTAILTTRLRADLGLSMGNKAYDGQGSQGELHFDDDDGEYGNEEDLPGGLTMLSVAAHNVITVVETATTPDTYLLNGRVGEKAIGRGDIHQDRSRQVRLTLEDSNSHLRGITLTSDQARSSESDVTRVTWVLTTFLQGSPRLTTNLTSRIIDSDTVTMPAKTYEAGTPIIDILRDCATASGKTFFVYNEGDGTLSLYYAVNTDASLRASMRISDRDSEIDFGEGIAGAVTVTNSDITHTNSGGAGFNDFGGLLVEEGQTIVAWVSYNGTNEITAVTYHPDGDQSTNNDPNPLTQVAELDFDGDEAHLEVWILQDAPAHTGGSGGGLRYQFASALDKQVYGWLVLDGAADYSFGTATGTGTAASVSTGAGPADFALNFLGWWQNVGTPGAATAGAGQTVVEQDQLDAAPGQRDGEGAVSYEVGDATASWTTATSVDWGMIAVTFEVEVATFPPIWVNDTASHEKGLGLLSGGVLRHGGGAVTSNDQDIVDAYDYWVEPINDVQAAGSADATNRLAKILTLRNTEDRTYTVAVQLENDQVDLVHAGDLIDIKARAIPDADDQYRTRRIANLEWQWAGPGHYLAVMELDRPLIGVGNPGSSGASKAEVSAEQKADAAVTAHESASDPHSGYVREVDANWVDLTDGGSTTLHSHAAGTASGSVATVQESGGGTAISSPTVLEFDATDFVVTGTDGGTASVALSAGDGYKPYYDPDRPPSSGTNAVTDEFDDESLDAAWTWTTAPSGTVSESQFPGYLHIDGGTDATPNTRYLRRTYAPGATDFSVATKCVLALQNGNFSSGIGIALLDSSDVEIWKIQLFTDGTTTASDAHRIVATAGTALTGGNVMNQPVYLLITRDSSNIYNAYWSRDGIIWQRIGGSTVATTVAKVALTYQVDTDSDHEEGAWDFVRVFDSITRKIGDVPA